MTVTGAFALFMLMCGMAALPSSSVALVVTRSALFGVGSGLAVAAGIVVGDLVFMTLAVLGMAALANQMGVLFAALQYLAAAYLIWLGIRLVRGGRGGFSFDAAAPTGGARHILASFGAGLLLTLGDIKAIFFYASLLPAFVDLSTVSWSEILAISAITVVAVGLVKSLYAICARRIAVASKGWALGACGRRLAGGFVISAGGYLLLRH